MLGVNNIHVVNEREGQPRRAKFWAGSANHAILRELFIDTRITSKFARGIVSTENSFKSAEKQ